MILLAVLREKSRADTRRAVGSEVLNRSLGWDGETLDRVLAHLVGKGLVTLSEQTFVDGRRVALTADGVEEVEWSILHPAEDAAGRSSWVVNWLFVIDAVRALRPETLDQLMSTLRESSDRDELEIGAHVEQIAGSAVWIAFKKLLHDPAFGQTIPAWIAVLLATLTLVQGCQQHAVSLEDVQRQTAILKEAVQRATESEGVTPAARDAPLDGATPAAPQLPAPRRGQRDATP